MTVPVSSAWEFVRIPLGVDLMNLPGLPPQPRFPELPGTPYRATTCALTRETTSEEDNLDGDFLVWGYEVVRGDT